MADLVFTADADQALHVLEVDPTARETVRRLWEALDTLAGDPASVRVRTRSYQAGPWGFVVRDRDEDWLILWQAGPDSGEVTVLYIGPDL